MINITAQENMIEDFKAFVNDYIKPKAKDIDINQSIDREIIRMLGEKKYFGIRFPAEYGGLGADCMILGRITEEVGKVCSSFRTLFTVHSTLVGESILRFGTEEQKKCWLPLIASGEKIAAFALSEPKNGSDARGITCQYRKTENGYVISGNKKWISFAGIADLFLVFAKSENGAISTFIVESDNPKIKTEEIKNLMGNRGSHMASIFFNDVEIPSNALLGKEGAGFDFVANYALDWGRYSIAWGGLAVAQAALEEMTIYSGERYQFGEKISEHQLIKGMIADAAVKVNAARLMCVEAAKLRMEKDEDYNIQATLAKYYTSKIACEVASDAIQILGAQGYCSEYPVERLFRDVKSLEIIEGTSQIQQLIIGKHIINSYLK